MKPHHAALIFSYVVVAAVTFLASSPPKRAEASVTLTTPIVQTTSAVACTSFQCNWGGGTDTQPVQCFINYQPVDGSGNFVPGTLQKTAGPLAGADLAAFMSTPGNARVRCQAALQSNQSSLAGTAL